MKLFRISSFLSIFAKVQSAAVPLMAAGQSDETAMTRAASAEGTSQIGLTQFEKPP